MIDPRIELGRPTPRWGIAHHVGKGERQPKADLSAFVGVMNEAGSKTDVADAFAGEAAEAEDLHAPDPTPTLPAEQIVLAALSLHTPSPAPALPAKPAVPAVLNVVPEAVDDAPRSANGALAGNARAGSQNEDTATQPEPPVSISVALPADENSTLRGPTKQAAAAPFVVQPQAAAPAGPEGQPAKAQQGPHLPASTMPAIWGPDMLAQTDELLGEAVVSPQMGADRPSPGRLFPGRRGDTKPAPQADLVPGRTALLEPPAATSRSGSMSSDMDGGAGPSRRHPQQAALQVAPAVPSDTPVQRPSIDGERNSPAREIAGLIACAVLEQLPPPSQTVVKTLGLVLRPEQLGEIHIVMRLRGSALELKIETQTADAAAAIEDDRVLLGQLLSGAGLDMAQSSIAVAVRDAGTGSPQPDTIGDRPSPSKGGDNLASDSGSRDRPRQDSPADPVARQQPDSGNTRQTHETQGPPVPASYRRRGLYI